MKRVRKQVLENLIVQFYSEFVKFQSYDLLEVKMYDTYIFFKDFSDFESKEEKKKKMKEFSQNLEILSFGNLKVAYMNIDKDCSWMYIANNYELMGN